MIDKRFFILLAPRQMGKTTLFGIYALHMACFNDNQRILIVANKGETAQEIFTRIRDAYEALPNWLKPGVKAIGKAHLELTNGSKINITKTTKNAARGKSINLLIIDEMAFIEKGLMEGFWKSTYPVISSSKTARILISSTPDGTDNIFYDIWKNAGKLDKNGKPNNWIKERVYWQEIPGRDEAWKQATIADIGSEERFNQEFGCEFLEFTAAGLPEEVKKKIEKDLCEPIITQYDGAYKIWKMPEEGRIYISGVDTAEGLNKNQSVIQIFDVTDLTKIEQVAKFASSSISPFEYNTMVNTILEEYGCPWSMIERNSIGAEIISRLVNDYGYKNLGAFDLNGKVDKDKPGAYSHTNSKARAVTNYRYWVIDRRRVIIHDKDTFNEMQSFVRGKNGTWGAKDGTCQDDHVMAMIWALSFLDNDICKEYFEIKKFDEFKRPILIASNLKGKIKKIDFISNNVHERRKFMPSYFGGSESFENHVRNEEIRKLQEEGFSMVKENKPKLNAYGVDMSYIFNLNY